MNEYRDGYWKYDENEDSFLYFKSGLYEQGAIHGPDKSLTMEEVLGLIALLEEEGLIVKSDSVPYKNEVLGIIHRLLDLLEED